MPLPETALVTLDEMPLGDFQLFGLFINPTTGEMGTYSSAGYQAGQVLGFLQRGINTLMDAVVSGELQMETEHGKHHESGAGTPGADIFRVAGGGSKIVH